MIENLKAPFDNSSQLKNNPLKVRNDIKTEPGQTENFDSNDFDSDIIVKQEFEEKTKIEILKKESYENRKESEHGLDEIEKMDFKDVSNPINITKPAHKMQKSYQCILCESNFSEETTLRNHISSIHEGVHFRVLNERAINFESRLYIAEMPIGFQIRVCNQ